MAKDQRHKGILQSFPGSESKPYPTARDPIAGSEQFVEIFYRMPVPIHARLDNLRWICFAVIVMRHVIFDRRAAIIDHQYISGLCMSADILDRPAPVLD